MCYLSWTRISEPSSTIFSFSLHLQTVPNGSIRRTGENIDCALLLPVSVSDHISLDIYIYDRLLLDPDVILSYLKTLLCCVHWSFQHTHYSGSAVLRMIHVNNNLLDMASSVMNRIDRTTVSNCKPTRWPIWYVHQIKMVAGFFTGGSVLWGGRDGILTLPWPITGVGELMYAKEGTWHFPVFLCPVM